MQYSEAIQFILPPAAIGGAALFYGGGASSGRCSFGRAGRPAEWGEFEAIEEPVGGIPEIQALRHAGRDGRTSNPTRPMRGISR
jgi:hypothetical protein